MRSSKLLIPLLLAAGLWPFAAAADVKVNFIEPQRYYDASLHGGYNSRNYSPTIKELETFFRGLAARYLGPGDELVIDVLDIDLAGAYESGTNYFDVRLLSEVTWPRIKMRYMLTRGDAPPITGVETVSDPSYMTFLNFRSGSESMSYEKVMLRRWFRMRFEAPKR